jgi:hypothetical protein
MLVVFDSGAMGGGGGIVRGVFIRFVARVRAV